MARPAGTPSMMVTSALPCDSPAVRKRSMRGSFYPKKLPRPGGAGAIGRAIRAGEPFAPEAEMQLVADRFAVDEGGRALDLASGARVTLITGSAGRVSDPMQWAGRCASLRGTRHRSRATLVDCGLFGETSRFEAWS